MQQFQQNKGAMMPQRSLIGHRLKDRRMTQGLTQRQLALQMAISPSYLNLIEHGKRGIGADLAARFAQALDVEVDVLLADGDEGLVARLSALAPNSAEPAERMVDLFPAWSRSIVAQADEIAVLAQDKAALTERALYDPALAAALHDVLSIVTSIRSTASILVEGAGDPEWEARFHGNIYNDSKRLADMSQALVEYLDGTRPIETDADRRALHVAPLDDMQAPFLEEMRRYKCDPAAVAQALKITLTQAMTMMAAARADDLPQMGFAACDGAGVITTYQPCDGFLMARMQGACPLWPVFQALQQPGRPIKQVVTMPGGQSPRLTCYAVAERVEVASFEVIAPIQSVMLVVADAPNAAAHIVGPGCATCAVSDCAARREAPQLRL